MVRDTDLACWNRGCTLPGSHPGPCCSLLHPHTDECQRYGEFRPIDPEGEESGPIGSEWDTLTEGKLVSGNYPQWPAVGTTLDGGVQLVITGLAPWLAACEREKAHQG
jgi:hypothetical protein